MKSIVRTNVGVVRKENQDRAGILISDDFVFAILCDGMGGHEGGSYASSITMKVFEKAFHRGIDSEPEKWFQQTIKRAKLEMFNFAKNRPSLLDMGTTVTAALISKKSIHVFNIGDSRTYIYNGLLHQITQDHNLRNHYISKFHYTPEEAAKVRGAAALTSALGPEKKVVIDNYVLKNEKNIKYFVLTSDGIHDYITKPNLEEIIASDDTLENKSDKIIAKAIKGKSSDNLTIAIVDMKELNW